MGFALLGRGYRMMSRIRILTMTMTLALIAPAMATAQPTGDQRIEAAASDGIDTLVVVRVDMDGGAEVAELMHADALSALRDAEVQGELSGGTPLEVVISPDAEQPGAYSVVLIHDGERVDAWSCACSGDELRARLRVTVVRAWKAIAVVKEAVISPASEPRVEAELPSDPLPKVSYGRGFGMWLGGLGAVVLGGSLVVGGAVTLIVDDARGIETRPIQLGLFGAGAVVAAAGIPLVVVGLRRMGQRSLSLAPPPRGRGLVLTLGARF